MSDHLAIGPDGGNLLGFLCSLGALATLSRAWPEQDVRLSWRFASVGWRPVFHATGQADDAELVTALDGELSGQAGAPEFIALGKDLPIEAETFAEEARKAADEAGPKNRRYADFLASFGCESTTDSKGRIQDTALRALGTGQTHFLGSMSKLVTETKQADLHYALFESWRYTDDGPSMRWDPVDDRRYAYRADNPAESKVFPIKTVRGANRLAIEALPFFPTMPRGRRLETACFPASDGRRALRWPIWSMPLTLATARSLLLHPDLASTPVAADRLRLLGVVEVFRSRRITQGQYRNFTPAEALLGVDRVVS